MGCPSTICRRQLLRYADTVAEFNFKQKPSGVFKWFLHAPTWVYRAHLGFLMGKRFIMIEHRGRKSDHLYRTVLEVAGRYPGKSEWIVTSGTGTSADWYRNLKAGKLDAVWVGSRRHDGASVRFLEPDESAAVFHDYESAHAKTAHKLLDSMGVSYDGSDEGRVEMMRKIPMVSFVLA